MDPAVLSHVLEDVGKIKLGGDSMSITCLFSDVAGFTRISEKLNSGQLIELLNRYFTPLTDIILGHGGFINKYQGDAIVAAFCVPIEPDEGGGDAARPGAAGEGVVQDPARPLLEGFCDLVYRSASGWVVVDYKTDAEPDEAAVTGRYGPQGGAYALAVRRLTAEPVVRVCFVLAAGAAAGRPAPCVQLPVTREMLEQARLAATGDAATRSVEDG